MINLIIAALAFFLLVFSTFFVIKLPFIMFFYNNLPPEIIITFQNNFITYGYFESNLQLPIIIFCSLIMNPRLSFVFILTYFLTGFYYYPVFYGGGGFKYIEANTIGYLLAFIPAILFVSNFAWKDSSTNPERYLFNSRYIFSISLIGLLIVHITGLLTTYIKLGSIYTFSDIFNIYLIMPLFSHIILIIALSIISTFFNRIKFYLLLKYKKSTDKLFKKITRRKVKVKKIIKSS